MRCWGQIGLVVLLAGCASGEGGDSDTDPGSLGSSAEDTETTGGVIPSNTSEEPGSSTTSTDPAPGSSGDTTSAESSTGCTPMMWWPDADEDGYGAAAGEVSDCEQPAGYVDNGDDCDDQDDQRSPGLVEVCDGIDNDCDDLRDEASPENTSCNGCTLFLQGDHSYAVCEAMETWADARSSCEALFSGDLLKVDDAAESEALAGFLMTVDPEGRWFIGLSDLVTEGTFLWIDDTEPSFTNWEMEEPNDFEGEDCTELRGLEGFRWNDISCGNPRPFICESPAP